MRLTKLTRINETAVTERTLGGKFLSLYDGQGLSILMNRKPFSSHRGFRVIGASPKLSVFGIANTGSSKKVPAKFSDTCSVRAGGLCIGCPKLVGSINAGNSNMQEFFCSTL